MYGSLREGIGNGGSWHVIGERERAYLVVQTARFFCIYIYLYIYIYPALMYAVMFYVILNKRKLHFPLAKNVMHSPSTIQLLTVYTVYVVRYLFGGSEMSLFTCFTTSSH